MTTVNPSESDRPQRRFAPAPLDRLDWLVALLVFAASLLVFMLTTQMGVTRDESFYFHAAHEYIGWFRQLWDNLWAGELADSFTQQNVDRYWSYNAEHPALAKTFFALSHEIFHVKLGWLSSVDALRLPGAAFGAGTATVVYLFGRQVFWRRWAGLVAVGCLVAQPRFFFHAHLTAFDVPVTFLWVATVYAYWRSYDNKWWAVACGVLFGLGLQTKLNAFFLPAVLGLHWLLIRWHYFGVERDAETTRIRIPRLPLAFVAMAILGPLLLFGLWPRIWFDTVDRFTWYLNFHLEHVHYFVEYFGEHLIRPPFPVSFPWVMTLVTVPATILLAFAIGVVLTSRQLRLSAWARRWWTAAGELRLPDQPAYDARGTGLLVAINFVFPIALIGMPETPVFGGTKHWMPAMAFLAIIAGGGVVLAADALRQSLPAWWRDGARRVLLRAAPGLLAAAVLVPAGFATAYNHPFGTSYYNELIGSYRGAADAGMMRQFWGYASRQALPWLNANAPENARVWTHNTTGWAFDAYKREGLARADLRPTSLQASQYALYHHQKAFVYQLTELWQEYGTTTPVHVVSIDGVPVLSVYERPPRPKPAPAKPAPKPAQRGKAAQPDRAAPKPPPTLPLHPKIDVDKLRQITDALPGDAPAKD